MIKIEMPTDEYMFLKQYYDDLDRYIVRMDYHVKDVVLHIMDDRFNEFRLDYNSMIVRKGVENDETVTPLGLRLKRIYKEYVQPVMETYDGQQ